MTNQSIFTIRFRHVAVNTPAHLTVRRLSKSIANGA